MDLLDTVVLILAMICFLLSAVGVASNRVNLLALGLFLLTLSFITP